MFRRVALLVLATSLVAGVVGAGSSAGAGVAGTGDRHRPRRDPVLLVHGFDGSAKSWRVMESRLRHAGYHSDEIAAVSYDSHASNLTAAHVIARAVDDIIAATGARRVDVVSHSMGAIASRVYIEELGGAASVDAWVSLAGVNNGTVWAYGCAFLTACREMLPGSEMLDTLAREFRADRAVRFATWWSPCDPAIIPPGNATIEGARNVETTCLGHSALKTDPTVFGQMLRFVEHRHRSLGHRSP